MVCISCSGDTRVVNSRPQKRHNRVWRRRQCRSCFGVVTTIEAADESTFVVKDSRGALKPFSRDVLFISVYESLRHRKTATSDATALTDTILVALQTSHAVVFASHQIREAVQGTLRRFDTAAAVHYEAFHTNNS